MEVTFLGHQGWVVAGKRASVLVDPLLTPQFTGSELTCARVFPPRAFDYAALPPVSAVLITHEHDDHFQVSSLNRIDRRVPLLLSGRMSAAAETIAQEMGFLTVVRIYPGDCLRIGDLDLIIPPVDHRGTESDELDVLPFALVDRAHNVSFATMVDLGPDVGALTMLRQLRVPPGIFAIPNNVASHSFGRSWECDDYDHLSRFATSLVQFVTEVGVHWAPPQTVLMCGGGWAFHGDREDLNHRFFPVSTKRALRAVKHRIEVPLVEVLPGMNIRARKNGGLASGSQQPYLRVSARRHWPDRTFRAFEPKRDCFSPATAVSFISSDEQTLLEQRLAELGSGLFARSFFKSLYSLAPGDLAEARHGYLLELLNDSQEGALRYAFSPQHRTFVRLTPGEPNSGYVAGMKCWASDLLHFLDVRMSPTGLLWGQLWEWMMPHVSRRLRPLSRDLWLLQHPLNQPERYARFYRECYAAESQDVDVVRARLPLMRIEQVTASSVE